MVAVPLGIAPGSPATLIAVPSRLADPDWADLFCSGETGDTPGITTQCFPGGCSTVHNKVVAGAFGRQRQPLGRWQHRISTILNVVFSFKPTEFCHFGSRFGSRAQVRVFLLSSAVPASGAHGFGLGSCFEQPGRPNCACCGPTAQYLQGSPYPRSPCLRRKPPSLLSTRIGALAVGLFLSGLLLGALGKQQRARSMGNHRSVRLENAYQMHMQPSAALTATQDAGQVLQKVLRRGQMFDGLIVSALFGWFGQAPVARIRN